MAATYTSWTATRYGGNATNRDHNVGSPAAGDKILVFVWRSNAATTGAQNHATSSGFTELDHVDPGGAYRMIGTVLEKTAAGTEGSINFDWTATDGEPDQIICSVLITDADNSSFVASLLDANSDPWTYPADTLDNSIHSGATQEDDDISTEMYPTGDSNVTHSTIGWRNGGISLSGGATASQAFGESQGGAFGTVSFSDGEPDLVSDVTTFTEGQEVQPDSALGTVTASLTGGTSNVKQYEFVLDDLTNTLTWNGSAWVAGAGFALLSADSLDSATPTSVGWTFTGVTLGETVSYAVRVRAKDQSDTWGTQTTRLFSAGTWKDATNITFTTLGAAPPSGTITNPSDNERLLNATTAGFTITGTAASAASTVTDVDISIDGGGLLAATDTGTDFDTWSRASGALTVGAHTLDIKITDALAAETDLTQIDFVVNELPTVSLSTPTAAQIFGYDEASVVVTGNASDDLQVTAVEVRHRTDAGAWGSWLAATNTGANFSTWTYTITGLAEGEAIDYEVRSADGDTDVSTSAARSFTVNNRPVVTGITAPTEAQNYAASSAHPNVVTTWSDGDSDNVDQVSYTLTRDSDGFYWDGVSAWQAGTITPVSDTGLAQAGTYTFTDATDSIELVPDIGTGIVYTFTAYVSDGLDTSAGFVRTFSSGSGIAPSLVLDSHLDGQVLANTTTEITFTGTYAAGDLAVDDVEYRTKLNDAAYTSWGSVTTAGLTLDGTSDYASTTDDPQPAAADDLDVKVWAIPDDITPAGVGSLAGQWDNAGDQRSWVLQLGTGGSLRLVVSSDGTSATQVVVSSSVGIDGTMRGFRAFYDQTANTVDFEYTLDNNGFTATWLPLGTQGLSLTTALHTTSTAALMCGANSGGSGSEWAGTMYRAEISYAGVVIASPEFDSMSSPATTLVDNETNTWTVTGATITYDSTWSQTVTGLEAGDVLTFDVRAVDTGGGYSA